ncbi:putative transcriptional regulator [Paenibacillus sp. RC254]|uniref:Transcriptional regulator n=1 Tax=Paenibacillus terrae TaxID=159743 RepID=A0A0D7X3U0_9BACL|nr:MULTISPECIES: helix-turn-helix transcriptional regulator [Paenibacillus]KJD44707.1 transcriptional regulator [Paenibacillus terrae]
MIKFMVDEMLKDREMTMYALAKKSGIRPNTISQWVSDGGADVKSITLDTLDRICAALDCQPGELLKYVKDTNQ